MHAPPRPESAAAIVPRCPHEGVCGGCGLQHLAYAEQRRWKRRRLQETLNAALGPKAIDVEPVLAPDGTETTDAPWGYRAKVHYVCGPGTAGEGIVLGHFGRGGQDLVPVVECPVHAERGHELAFAVRDACLRLSIPGATADGRGGLLRHVVVRVGHASGEVSLTLVVTDARDRRLRQLTDALREGARAPDAIHVNELTGPSSWLFGPETRTVHGRNYLRENVAGMSFLVPPTGFFQTNVVAADTLARLVLEAVPAHVRHVLDLYAGVGLFALPLAHRGQRVVAVEEQAGAVDAARRSQRLNRIDERACRFVRARAEEAIKRLPIRAAGTLAVVLDPPRTGCPPRLLRALLSTHRPETLVYVSCDPDALARDLAMCFEAMHARTRYRLERVQPLDMFPHTPHLETVAVMTRESAPDAPARGVEPAAPARIQAGGTREQVRSRRLRRSHRSARKT